MLLANVGRSPPLLASLASSTGGRWSGGMSGMGNAMAMMGGVAAGRGQFRWRSQAAAVTKVEAMSPSAATALFTTLLTRMG